MIFCVENQRYEKCVTKGGRYGWGKNKKKTDLKITKFYAEGIPISSRRKRSVEK